MTALNGWRYYYLSMIDFGLDNSKVDIWRHASQRPIKIKCWMQQQVPGHPSPSSHTKSLRTLSRPQTAICTDCRTDPYRVVSWSSHKSIAGGGLATWDNRDWVRKPRYPYSANHDEPGACRVLKRQLFR